MRPRKAKKTKRKERKTEKKETVSAPGSVMLSALLKG